MNRKLFTAASTVAILAFAGHAQAETFNLRIGAGHPVGALWVGSIKDFFMPEVAKRVEERTDHTITWTEGFGGTVCKLGECLEAVESNLLDIADIEAAFEPAKLMALQGLDAAGIERSIRQRLGAPALRAVNH